MLFTICYREFPTRRPAYLGVALLVLAASLTIPQRSAAQSGLPAPWERVDQLFSEWDRPDSPGAALAVIQDGQVILSRGYGMANLEYDIPITPSSVFHVASVSKHFTAFAVSLLAAEGKLSLDDDIRTYLPEVPDFGKTITIRHLIHHTSGLRDQWELLAMAGWRLDDVITKEHILNMISRQQALNFDPGEQHLYSNTGYTLMAEIVERVSGMSFPTFAQERIFRPLGMRNTHFHDDHTRIVRNRAYSYAPLPQGGFQHSPLNYANVGATSLFTTVEDLALWDRNFYDARVGGPEVIEQMHTQGGLNNGQQLEYAFGLSIGRYRGATTVGHSGADAGYRSYYVRFPEHRLSVVILSNVSILNPTWLALGVASIYLADQFEPAAPRPAVRTQARADLPLYERRSSERPNQLHQFEGAYYSEELGTTYTLVVRNGRLVAQHKRHSDVLMEPVAADRFVGDQWWFRQIRFTRDEQNQVTGLALTGSRTRNVRFVKQQP